MSPANTIPPLPAVRSRRASRAQNRPSGTSGPGVVPGSPTGAAAAAPSPAPASSSTIRCSRRSNYASTVKSTPTVLPNPGRPRGAQRCGRCAGVQGRLGHRDAVSRGDRAAVRPEDIFIIKAWLARLGAGPDLGPGRPPPSDSPFEAGAGEPQGLSRAPITDGTWDPQHRSVWLHFHTYAAPNHEHGREPHRPCWCPRMVDDVRRRVTRNSHRRGHQLRRAAPDS